ncbi:hypothetical protein JCM9957A_49980 [Kineosporia succinea]|uniref:Uncharacterized protein n=1 Tax=Kineosporia succinea TaxID=84632 RepID=A0ABT9PB47_9ACTN|nr:hypothetical protein [Kineosporia succinea]
MDYADISLSYFEVDCDGSACGSGNVGEHLHPAQFGAPPIARVIFRKGERVRYEGARWSAA